MLDGDGMNLKLRSKLSDAWSYASTHPIYLHDRDNFTFIYVIGLYLLRKREHRKRRINVDAPSGIRDPEARSVQNLRPVGHYPVLLKLLLISLLFINCMCCIAPVIG